MALRRLACTLDENRSLAVMTGQCTASGTRSVRIPCLLGETRGSGVWIPPHRD